MGEVAGDVVLAHRGGIARPMKEQKASDPTDVRFLCPVAVMPCADRLADLVKSLGTVAAARTLAGSWDGRSVPAAFTGQSDGSNSTRSRAKSASRWRSVSSV